MPVSLPLVDERNFSSTLGPGKSSSRMDDDWSPEQSPREEFWNKVEGFLNKPAPKLKQICKNGTTKKGGQRVLPKLSKEAAPAPSRPKVKSTNYGKKAKSKNQENRDIDQNLLQEAFAYAESLSRTPSASQPAPQHQLADMPPIQAPNPRHSKGRLTKSNSTATQKKKKKVKAKKNSALTAQASYSSARPGKARKWNSSDPYANGDDGALDSGMLNDLVKNFENGTTLQKLRRDLENSQTSLSNSRSVLQTAAQEFFSSR